MCLIYSISSSFYLSLHFVEGGGGERMGLFSIVACIIQNTKDHCLGAIVHACIFVFTDLRGKWQQKFFSFERDSKTMYRSLL